MSLFRDESGRGHLSTGRSREIALPVGLAERPFSSNATAMLWVEESRGSNGELIQHWVREPIGFGFADYEVACSY